MRALPPHQCGCSHTPSLRTRTCSRACPAPAEAGTTPSAASACCTAPAAAQPAAAAAAAAAEPMALLHQPRWRHRAGPLAWCCYQRRSGGGLAAGRHCWTAACRGGKEGARRQVGDRASGAAASAAPPSHPLTRSCAQGCLHRPASAPSAPRCCWCCCWWSARAPRWCAAAARPHMRPSRAIRAASAPMRVLPAMLG